MQGVREAGATPQEFNTVAISDGITMGTEGMKTSLVSREVIADSIELVARGHMFDAVICLVGCDKTAPGAAMALARLGVPGMLLYGGSIAPGRYKGRDITIQDVFEGVGAHAAGRITDADLKELEDTACPGAGSAAGSSRPTPWPSSWSSWAWPRWARRASPPPTPAKTMSPSPPGT